MTETENFFDIVTSREHDPENPLRDMLLDLIYDRDAATPRHQQKSLGPSDIGHPCMRKMAYAMADNSRSNPQWDPLPSIIGVATHKWLDSAARYANEKLGRQRFLAETKLTIIPGVRGTADLYDRDTNTVIDWKVPGTNRFNTYRKDPGPVFKAQVQMYGLGFEQAGMPVDTVAIALLPRGKTLKSMHVWSAPYDPDLAVEALTRREAVIAMLADFDVANNPDRFEWFPKGPYDCIFCPWFSPRPTGPLTCKGDQ